MVGRWDPEWWDPVLVMVAQPLLDHGEFADGEGLQEQLGALFVGEVRIPVFIVQFIVRALDLHVFAVPVKFVVRSWMLATTAIAW